MTETDEHTDARLAFVTPLRDDIAWGLYCVGAGLLEVLPGPVDLIGSGGRVLDCYSLVYITDGQGTFWSTPERSISVKAGDLLLLFPGTWHRYKTNPKTGWKEIWIMFDGAYAKHLHAQHILSPSRAVTEIGLDHQLGENLTHIVDLLEGEEPGYQQQAASTLMQALIRIHHLMVRDLPARQRQQNETIERAIMHLNAHSQSNVDLQALARSLALSYARFRQLFKSATGMSPRQFHIAVRINEAKRLLTTTSLTVSEIAGAVGFDDPHYFSRSFRKKTDLSPSEWRRGGSAR